MMQQDRVFTAEDREVINPCNSISIDLAMDFVKNPVKCCERVQDLIQRLMNIVRCKKDDPKTKGFLSLFTRLSGNIQYKYLFNNAYYKYLIVIFLLLI